MYQAIHDNVCVPGCVFPMHSKTAEIVCTRFCVLQKQIFLPVFNNKQWQSAVSFLRNEQILLCRIGPMDHFFSHAGAWDRHLECGVHRSGLAHSINERAHGQ